MTPNEERNYLCELILASSQWRISEGDETDAIRLEVQDRLRRLNGVNTVDDNGYCQSDPDNLPAEDEPLTGADYQALEAQKLNDYIEQRRAKERISKDKWKKDKVRVYINGKSVWKLRSECRKVPRWPDKPEATGWKWEWVGPQDKQSQVDAMWEAHERS